MKGMCALALAVVIGAISSSGWASNGPTAIEADQDSSYPRIGQSDLHNTLLKTAIQSWDDELLALHLYGSPARGADGFAQREQQQLNLAKAAEERAAIDAQPLRERFRIGLVNVSKDPYASGLRGYGMPGFRRFRMRGYHEEDLTTRMSLEAYDFGTRSFTLIAPFLPCDSSGTSRGQFGSSGHVISYRIQKWHGQLMPPTSLCVIRIEDQKIARKIEEARHQGRLAIGATVHTHFDESMDGDTYVLYADRIDVDFYRDESGKGTYARLGGTTLRAPRTAGVVPTSQVASGCSDSGNAKGLDLSDPKQVEICAAMGALTQTIAEESLAAGIPARETAAYATTRRHAGELADVMAVVVDRLGGRMKPHVIRSWSMYGYCHGMDDDLIFGEAADKVAAACNEVPDEASGQCINDLLLGNFNALPPAEQERLKEAARQLGY